jgi:hypothetical protein
MFLKTDDDDRAINLSFIEEIKVENDDFSIDDLWCVVGYSKFILNGVCFGKYPTKEQAVEQLGIILEATSG